MFTIILYSFLSFISAFSGTILSTLKIIEHKTQEKAISFGAGYILSIGILFLIPEAIEGRKAFWILIGFLFIYLGEHLFMMHGCIGEDCQFHRIGIAAFIGLSLHTIASGISISATLIKSPVLGFITFLAIVLHKGPEAFSLGVILKNTNLSKKNLWALFLLYSLLIPLSSIPTFFIFKKIPESFLSALIGFSAGTFLEIGGADLLPQVHKVSEGRGGRFLSFIFGVLIAILSEGLFHFHHYFF